MVEQHAKLLSDQHLGGVRRAQLGSGFRLIKVSFPK